MGFNKKKWSAARVAMLLICLYGFFKEFKPSEPFLNPYLVTVKNFTNVETENDIYPYWTYSNLIFLAFIGILVEFSRYRPVLLLESFSYLATRILLIWGTSLLSMQIMQVCYGLASATDVAYFSVVYFLVPEEHYQRATGYVNAAILFGQASSGILAQILVSAAGISYLVLNYISFASVCLALIISIVLIGLPIQSLEWDQRQSTTSTLDDTLFAVDSQVPYREQRVWHENTLIGTDGDEHDDLNSLNEAADNAALVANPHADSPTRPTVKEWFVQLWTDMRECYSAGDVLFWALWLVIALALHNVIGNFVQNLWSEIRGVGHDQPQDVYNGAAEAVSTLGGAMAALVPAATNLHTRSPLNMYMLPLAGLVMSASVIAMALSNTSWLAYICYFIYKSMLYLTATLASAKVAEALPQSRYGAVFGYNSFIGIALATILTAALGKGAIDAPLRTRFLVYGGAFGLTAVAYLYIIVYRSITARNRRRQPRHMNTEASQQLLNAMVT